MCGLLHALYRIGRCHQPDTDIDALIDEALSLADESDIIEITITHPQTVLHIQEMVRIPLALRVDVSNENAEEILREGARLYNGVPLLW